MICQNSFSKFPDVLTAFICARAICNLRGISSGVSVLSPFWCVASYPASKIFEE